MARRKIVKPGPIIDPEEMFATAIAGNLDPSIFEKIDDRDIPQARNVVEWCTGAGFMNSSVFAIQAETLVRLFAEFCPACSDPDYLRDVPVQDSIGLFQERVQLLEFGRCPKCQKNRVELFEEIPEELVAVWGQRSGKSITAAAQGATYQLHRFLKIPHVAKYFKQHMSQKFDIVFTAVDKSVAQSTLWATFATAHNTSPWFQMYRNFLKQRCAELSIPDQAKSGETFIYYGGTKNIMATFKAPNMGSLRGDTRIYTATDELSFMSKKENAIKANANEVYNSLANSLRTIRSASHVLRDQGDYNAPTGLMVNISSPVSSFDKTMLLLKEGQQDRKKVCSHRATWEVNPTMPKSHFKTTLVTNPLAYWRDFAAMPPLGDGAFLGTESQLERMLGTHEPIFRTRPIHVTDKVGASYVAAEILQPTLRPDKQTPRIVAVDAGETGNSFAIAVYSAIKGEDNQIGLRVDAVIEVAPEADHANDTVLPVHFPTMSAILVEITKHFNVHVVLWDRWQSTGEIQRLREAGIQAEKYSPKYEDFLALRGRIWSGLVQSVKPEMPLDKLKEFDITDPLVCARNPWSHFFIQTATVRGSGKKVLKPENGEDDLFRTMVLASHWISDSARGVAMLAGGLPVTRPGLTPRTGAQVMVYSYGTRSGGGGNSGATAVATSGTGRTRPAGSIRRSR